ncbi:MAG: AMP-binding protein, partial [Methylibium sp.]
MNLARWLVRAALAHPDRPAVLLGDAVVLDYRALADRAARLAGHLRGTLGLQPGERVALCMHNDVGYLELLYATWWAGLVVVPINAKLHPSEVAFIVGDAEAAVLFISEDLAADMLVHHATLPTLRHVFTPA